MAFPLSMANYGSAATMYTDAPYAGGTDGGNIDMVRRARSFEVGEWQNSMAAGSAAFAMQPDMIAMGDHLIL